MPTKRKPRTGSLQYWPRKRARRIFPVINSYPSIDESKLEKPKILAFAGFKAGMAHVIMKNPRTGSASFGEDISVPVTIIDCPPIAIVGARAYKRTSSGLTIITEAWADKLPKGIFSEKAKRSSASSQFEKMEKESGKIVSIRLIAATQPELAAFGKKSHDIFEVELAGKTEDKLKFAREIVGKDITPGQVLKEGEVVDAIAITKGKGTEGPIKRFGAVIQSNRAKGKRRHIGSLGQENPGRVRWTVPMSGQLGFQKRTELNKRIIKIDDSGKEFNPASGLKRYGLLKSSYILVEGSVPGPKRRLVFLRAPIRAGRIKNIVPEIREVVV